MQFRRVVWLAIPLIVLLLAFVATGQVFAGPATPWLGNKNGLIHMVKSLLVMSWIAKTTMVIMSQAIAGLFLPLKILRTVDQPN